MATRTTKLKPPTGILQLHIELKDIKPKVWRCVLVPETLTLLKLHLVIQRFSAPSDGAVITCTSSTPAASAQRTRNTST